jgi:hypothetical protein
MALVIFGILVVAGMVAALIFRSKSRRNDRRTQEANSKR